MTTIYVHTQDELDAALANPEYACASYKIVIDSPEGVWLTIADSYGKDVEAWGNAMVVARDRATVVALDRATVKAWGSAMVRAGDRATVRAWDGAMVEAWGSATVEVWDGATVEAWGSATVRAGDRATVRAGTCVAVHVYSQLVAYQGGVIIDMTAINTGDPKSWCAMQLVEVDNDRQAHLYKALDEELNAGHGYRLTQYPIGQVVDDTEHWVDNNKCGDGLHASPTPWLAKLHYTNASRFVEVCCPVEDLRPIDSSKAKAPRFRVLREVTLDGGGVA